MKLAFSAAILLASSLALCGQVQALSEDGSNTFVRKYGANGDGVNDDTFGFQQAIAAVKAGGVVILPDGNYTLSDTIVITKPVTIIGTGFATQIYNKNNKTLFRFVNVDNAAIRDVYLGSNSTQPNVSLIEFVNSHHNVVSNVTMLGGYYGLHLQGSLLNTITDLRSGTNFQGFFAPTSINHTWVMAEPYNQISANSNTFIAPVLEGGTNGLLLTDTGGQGSLHILGGTIEGVAGTGLQLQSTFLPTSITGLHFEANGQADILINSSSNVRLTAITSLPGPSTNAPTITLTGDTRNVQLTDSLVSIVNVDPSTKRIVLQNLTFGIAGSAYCAFSNINVPVGATTFNPSYLASLGPLGTIANITASNVGDYCGGQ
jgi:Pectate lyase superfamily protein